MPEWLVSVCMRQPGQHNTLRNNPAPVRLPGSKVSTLLRSLVSTVAAASLASWALQYRYGSLALHRQPLAWKLVAVARSQSLALQVAGHTEMFRAAASTSVMASGVHTWRRVRSAHRSKEPQQLHKQPASQPSAQMALESSNSSGGRSHNGRGMAPHPLLTKHCLLCQHPTSRLPAHL